MTAYALSSLHLSSTIALGTLIASGSADMLMDLPGGWLSDRFGRKPVMLLATLALVALVVPAFWLINRYPGWATLYLASVMLAAHHEPQSLRWLVSRSTPRLPIKSARSAAT